MNSEKSSEEKTAVREVLTKIWLSRQNEESERSSGSFEQAFNKEQKCKVFCQNNMISSKCEEECSGNNNNEDEAKNGDSFNKAASNSKSVNCRCGLRPLRFQSQDHENMLRMPMNGNKSHVRDTACSDNNTNAYREEISPISPNATRKFVSSPSNVSPTKNGNDLNLKLPFIRSNSSLSAQNSLNSSDSSPSSTPFGSPRAQHVDVFAHTPFRRANSDVTAASRSLPASPRILGRKRMIVKKSDCITEAAELLTTATENLILQPHSPKTQKRRPGTPLTRDLQRIRGLSGYSRSCSHLDQVKETEPFGIQKFMGNHNLLPDI
eukprot:gene6852-7621_t